MKPSSITRTLGEKKAPRRPEAIRRAAKLARRNCSAKGFSDAIARSPTRSEKGKEPPWPRPGVLFCARAGGISPLRRLPCADLEVACGPRLRCNSLEIVVRIIIEHPGFRHAGKRAKLSRKRIGEPRPAQPSEPRASGLNTSLIERCSSLRATAVSLHPARQAPPVPADSAPPARPLGGSRAC